MFNEYGVLREYIQKAFDDAMKPLDDKIRAYGLDIGRDVSPVEFKALSHWIYDRINCTIAEQMLKYQVRKRKED